jgi:hypothetical protein
MSVFDSTVVDLPARGATGGALPGKADTPVSMCCTGNDAARFRSLIIL